jgi:outer membrane usher protein
MQPHVLHLASLLVLMSSAEPTSAAGTIAYSWEGIIDSNPLAQGKLELSTPQSPITKAVEPSGSDPQPPVRTDARSIDQIYRDVFGRDRPAATQDDYPILIDGINVGVFGVRPDSDTQDGSVDSDFVTKVLAPLTTDEARATLEDLSKQQEVTFSQLGVIGIIAKFDANNLALMIEIPLSIRGIRTLDLRGLRSRSNVEFVEQARFSAYLSVRAGVGLVEDSAFTKPGFDRLAADFDLAMNMRGLVLESDLRYDERRARHWTRGDTRLTYDLLDSLIRFEAGDLSIGRRTFQSSPRIGGIAAFRNYSIDPYRNVRPVPDQLFELEDPARVEVLINGIPTRTFDLPPGRFSLRDFPLVPSAANDIELRITDASGRVNVVSFPAFFDLDLLAPGLLDFAFNFGLPYETRDGLRVYDDKNYNSIGYVRYGFSNTFTAGLNWQGDENFDQIGADILWASPVGTFGVNAATDIRNPGQDSSQLTLQYRWRDTDRERNRTIDGLINLTGRDFRTLDQLLSGNFIARQARLRVGQNFGPNASVQAFAGYESLRGGLGESWFLGANYTHQFRFGSISVGAEYRDTVDRNDIVVTAAFSVPLGRGSLNGSASSEGNTARVEYNHFAPVGVGALGFRASAERRDGSDRQLVQASYTGNRFEATIGQRSDNMFSDQARRDLRSEFSIGSAIVMADGHFGLSRPVRNAFAIFAPRRGVADYKIAVEPRTGFGSNETRYAANSGALGPAVVPQLPAYLNRSLQVDAPGAPAGISVGGQVFSVRPGYRAGYYLPIGNERNVSIVGNLVDRDGDPIAYATGSVAEIGPAIAIEPSAIFTNAVGRFFVEGVEAGKSYRISLTIAGTQTFATINIPAELSGILTLDAPLTFDVDVPSSTRQENGS